jgi:hypothetical protein
MLHNVVEGFRHQHAATMKSVFNCFEELSNAAERQHSSLCHWSLKINVHVHNGLQKMLQIVCIQQTLKSNWRLQ